MHRPKRIAPLGFHPHSGGHTLTAVSPRCTRRVGTGERRGDSRFLRRNRGFPQTFHNPGQRCKRFRKLWSSEGSAQGVPGTARRLPAAGFGIIVCGVLLLDFSTIRWIQHISIHNLKQSPNLVKASGLHHPPTARDEFTVLYWVPGRIPERDVVTQL